jgi:RNA polymerase sigma factor (sigma-70 family)
LPESSLQRVAAGDTGAVNEILDRYGGLVWSIARRMSVDPADVEDAVQEIFIDLWRNAARFDAECGSESAFITMLARRRLVDRHRKRSRRTPTTSLDDAALDPAGPNDGAVQARSELDEAAQQARNSMGRLKPEERRVLELSVYHGLSQTEIADKMQLPLGTVKTHSRRGLIRLRELLGAPPREQSRGGAR